MAVLHGFYCILFLNGMYAVGTLIQALYRFGKVLKMEAGFQVGPTFPIFPTFPYFFYLLLLFPTFMKMPYYPYFFTLKCHLRVKIQKVFLARFAGLGFII